MVYYMDCSRLPLRGAIGAPWFDAGIMQAVATEVGDADRDAEQRAFVARFAAREADVPRMRELAQDLRSEARAFRRLQPAALHGAPGVEEDESGGAQLLFPLPAAKLDKVHGVDVLRSADGAVARLAETVKVLPPPTAHDARAPLPALFVPGDWWGATYADGAMLKQASNALLGLEQRQLAYGALNPALFGLAVPIAPGVRLSFSMLEALLQPVASTAVPGGVPSYALRTPLVAHVGNDAVDAHAALLGELQHAQCGWERYAADRTIRGIQQRANVVLFYLEQRSRWASALSQPMMLGRVVTALRDALATLGLAAMDRSEEALEAASSANGDVRTATDAFALLIDAETNAPWWRRLADGVDDAFCHFALLYVLCVYFASTPLISHVAAPFVEYPWPVDAWAAYRRSLSLRYGALSDALNEQVARVRALIVRYGAEPDEDDAVLALIAKRRLLRFALLDALRLVRQRDALRHHATNVRIVDDEVEARFAPDIMNGNTGGRFNLMDKLRARQTPVLPAATHDDAMLAAQYGDDASFADTGALGAFADGALVRSLLVPVTDILSL